MKKILLSLALLFLVSCATTNYQPTKSIKDVVQIGNTKAEMCASNWRQTIEYWPPHRALCHSMFDANYKYFPDTKVEIINNGGPKVYFVFYDVNQRMSCRFDSCNYGDGKLAKIVYNLDEAVSLASSQNVAEFKKNEEKEKIIKDIEAKKIFAQQEQQRKLLETEKVKQKIIDDQQKVIDNKHKEEANKLAKMSSDDRRAFTCSEKFGFRKGSDKFKDCVFKIYQAELELEKLELQRELAKANAETAKVKAEAARASEERQQNLARAQTEAATMQALAARQQAIAANTASSLQMIESGLRMMSPQQPAPRLQTNCYYHARSFSCF